MWVGVLVERINLLGVRLCLSLKPGKGDRFKKVCVSSIQ